MDYKEKLKAIINSNKTPFADIDTFLKYFPELKESEDERIRKELINYFLPVDARDSKKQEWIAWLEKQGEQKPAEWSEKDESMLNFVKIVLNKHKNDAFFDEFKTTLDDCLLWFRDIKCRVGSKVNCTTARKWSGEDEELCEHLIKSIEELDPLPTSIYSDCKKWLNSLKDRYSWMPSEEEMKALSIVMCGVDDPLFSLYQDLKKLREE